MEAGALLPYEQCLVNGETLLLQHGDSTVTALSTWTAGCARPMTTDRHALLSVVAPALDVGCGPGPHRRGPADQRGIRALGIDIAGTAVTLARARGANVHRYDVFGRVPAAGTWQTVLLLDGNIGIGGDPRGAAHPRPMQLLAPVRHRHRRGARGPRHVRAAVTSAFRPRRAHGRADVRLGRWWAGTLLSGSPPDSTTGSTPSWTNQRRAFAALRAPAAGPVRS